MDEADTKENIPARTSLAKQEPRPLSRNQDRVEKSVTGQTMMKETMILLQGRAKQLQMRNKHTLGTWNIQSVLQLICEDMMTLGVGILCGLSEMTEMDKGISQHWMAAQ